MTDVEWVVLAIVTMGIIGFIFYRVARVWRTTHEDPVPTEVREKSHAVANEATALRYTLREISKAPDPIAELVRTMTEGRRSVEAKGLKSNAEQ